MTDNTTDILLIAGLGLGAYGLYKFNKDLTPEEITSSSQVIPISPYTPDITTRVKEPSVLDPDKVVFRDLNDDGSITSYPFDTSTLNPWQQMAINNDWYRIVDGRIDYTLIPRTKDWFDDVAATMNRGFDRLDVIGAAQGQWIKDKAIGLWNTAFGPAPTKAAKRITGRQAGAGTITDINASGITRGTSQAPTKAATRVSSSSSRGTSSISNSNPFAKTFSETKAATRNTTTGRQTGSSNGVSYNIPSTARITGSLSRFKR